MSWSGPSSSPHRKPSSQERITGNQKPRTIAARRPAALAFGTFPSQRHTGCSEIHLPGPRVRAFRFLLKGFQEHIQCHLLYVYIYQAVFRAKSLRIRFLNFSVCCNLVSASLAENNDQASDL